MAILLLAFASCTAQTKPPRYLPLGDSYTICTGASQSESWPQLLADHLKVQGKTITLLDNPARNGFTTQDLIDNELPYFDKSKPEVVTLLIGVNDWVQGVDLKTFSANYKLILDHLQAGMADPQRILLITIPDFGVTPTGQRYSHGRNISDGIDSFNQFILQEAERRNLKTVDLFQLSKDMGDDSSLVASDGLHPSAKEYALWEKKILPVFTELLK